MSAEPSGHAALVLAAGSSTRLGQPKQLLRQQGESLLHRTARLARGTHPARLVVVLPQAQGRLIDELRDIDHQSAFNPHPELGLTGSLLAAAPQVMGFRHVLVMTCDQPALSPGHLVRLLLGARHASAGCAATDLEGVLGVPAVVPGQWFAELQAERPDSGFRARLRALPGADVGRLEAPGLQLDIDTPEDLERARAFGLIDR